MYTLYGVSCISNISYMYLLKNRRSLTRACSVTERQKKKDFLLGNVIGIQIPKCIMCGLTSMSHLYSHWLVLRTPISTAVPAVRHCDMRQQCNIK